MMLASARALFSISPFRPSSCARFSLCSNQAQTRISRSRTCKGAAERCSDALVQISHDESHPFPRPQPRAPAPRPSRGFPSAKDPPRPSPNRAATRMAAAFPLSWASDC
ncbi:hypothetical protein CC80DRAFT_494874 [Byssothecium circinans]|uniref:Uncharacterized protein n=1 Tax=Byssothecium circinans TaxID=147558 RepID=A0A6A5TKM0_9PLEO|nr:hypothetical protein CC80DRAFT_494874 [Byssothecium circinans]